MAVIEVVAVFALFYGGCVSQVITNPPQNATIREGEDTTFTCTAEENGMALTIPYGWRFTPSGPSSEVPLDNGTTLTGIEMVTVSGGLRTTLTFSGVQRDANGGTVTCIATGSIDSASASGILNVQWPPTVNSGESITLQVGDSYPSVSINFTEGNPRSSMTITGPSQPGNPRVSISSDGVVNINGVSRDDAGTHTATWRNDAGSATFTLDLDVNGGGPKGLSAGAIAAMVVCSLVFMALGN